MTKTAKQIEKFADISNRYEALICDIWGVVHNGLRANEGAVNALIKYRQNGGRVILVTNASRTRPYIQKMLDNMNIDRAAYDVIVTSGDVTRELIAKYNNQIVHHVGIGMDHAVFEGLNIIRGAARDAKAVVVTGLDDDRDRPEKYQERLEQWLDLGLELICTNPDKIVEVGDMIVYCAGALADIYHNMGGKVLMAGKPYEPIYRAAFAELEKISGKKIAREKILAIGDSVRTDARGAANMGIDFLFIAGSIHAKELNAFDNLDAQKINNLIAPSKANLIGFQIMLE